MHKYIVCLYTRASCSACWSQTLSGIFCLCFLFAGAAAGNGTAFYSLFPSESLCFVCSATSCCSVPSFPSLSTSSSYVACFALIFSVISSLLIWSFCCTRILCSKALSTCSLFTCCCSSVFSPFFLLAPLADLLQRGLGIF